MPECLEHTDKIDDLRDQLISNLMRNQKSSGEFELFVAVDTGRRFYVGESPFLTAHILYFLNDLNDLNDGRIQTVINKGLDFLEKIDYTGKRIYKFWYQDANGTDYPFLPFDLDDTSVVNQVLGIYGRRTVRPSVLLNNRTKTNLYYTWLKPSIKTLIHSPSYFFVYLEYFKAYRIFMANGANPPMANYNDTEIIARMNVYIMMDIIGADPGIIEQKIPFKLGEIEEELLSSLHYANSSVYYLTLSKFQNRLNHFDEESMEGLANEIRQNIGTNNRADDVSLYLSLALINKLSIDDMERFLRIAGETAWETEAFNICVGNKKYADFHVYNSFDLTLAMGIKLLSIMQGGRNATNLGSRN